MLQRAASNAYSWWWASNIRTKQSKWLDSNLQEMEEKVKTIVKLIDVDADSFAKKAEMYYQRRPELIKFVEETYKAYKALADRYDRVSGELHKANHTLASAFPDQFQFAMQDDDEDGSPRAFTNLDASKFRKALPGEVPQINFGNKSRDTLAALKKHHKKVTSHITKGNPQNEIDRLQKAILVLQTEKEFVKSSYESSLAKFWEIENQITDFQDEVCNLQDEYSASSIIEDNEARALMAARAIKSCEESLVNLQLQQKKSGEEAEMESKRIREVKNRLKFLKGENCSPEIVENFDKEISNKEGGEGFHLKNEGLDLDSVCAQVKQHFQMNSHASVVDLAEKIDELVEKVISLEVTVSLQTAQIHTLRSDTDMLQKHLRGLEEDKANSIVDSNNLNGRLREAEDELHGVQDLEKVIHHEKVIVQTHFLEACNSFNDITEKLQSPSPKENDSISASSNIENLEQNKEVKEDIRDERGDAAAEEDAVLVKQEVEPNDIDTKDQSHSNEPSNGASSSQKETQMQNKEENGNSIQGLTVKPDSPFEIVDTEEKIKLCYLDQQHSTSPIEEKFRVELDTLLDENLSFWLKFSSSYHHLHKFEASFKELQAGLDKMKDPKEGGSAPASPKQSSKQDTTPLDKKLRELHTELQVWIEQNDLLKGELQCRFTSLCNIQEEISKASRDIEGEDSKFTQYQAAKFQGELHNMQQENNKVAMELQTGLDHVKALQSQVAKALAKLRESFDLSVSNGYQQYQNFRHCSTRSKVPLRTFLFGEKRKKPSIFSCISPALHRHHHSQMKSGFPS